MPDENSKKTATQGAPGIFRIFDCSDALWKDISAYNDHGIGKELVESVFARVDKAHEELEKSKE